MSERCAGGVSDLGRDSSSLRSALLDKAARQGRHDRGMPSPPPAFDQAARSLADAHRLRDEILRKERAIRRRTQTVAKAPVNLMGPGGHLPGRHRHPRFRGSREPLPHAAYLEDPKGVRQTATPCLCGGEAKPCERRGWSNPRPPVTRTSFRAASPHRAWVTYIECEEFLERLPKFIADASTRPRGRLQRTDDAETRLREGQRALRAANRDVPNSSL